MSAPGFTPLHRGGSGEPLVLLHGFTDTWRTWELCLPQLERRHDVLAPTLAGHAGGTPLDGRVHIDLIADEVERAMDAAGFETAHVAGNSLGGWVALQLAARGRARTVTAVAPAGGWDDGDDSFRQVLGHFTEMRAQLAPLLPHADAIAGSEEGRRRALQLIATNWEHVPADLVAHQIRGVIGCDGAEAMIALALREGWPVHAERIACPVRMVWGTADQVLPYPSAAVRYRRDWLPHADWVILDDVGHCPQLDVPLEAAELIAGFTGA
jgi:pimeloyl-ACP methyl ester carboxylesterase